MALDETSSVLIWDLSNSCVVPSVSYDLANFSFANNTMTDEDAWNILKMEENLDWILSYEPQNTSPTPTLYDTVEMDSSPPSPIMSGSEPSEPESCTESSPTPSPETCEDIEWIPSTRLTNLPQKTRLKSTSIDSDSESSGTESNSDSSNETEWIPTNKQTIRPRKIGSTPKRSKNRKPNVSHWLWELLQNKKNRKMIAFTDEKIGEFRIMDQKAIAYLWGCRNGKENLKMNYKDLARTMRYHYKKSKGQELQAVNRHLVYRFSRHFLNARRNEVV